MLLSKTRVRFHNVEVTRELKVVLVWLMNDMLSIVAATHELDLWRYRKTILSSPASEKMSFHDEREVHEEATSRHSITVYNLHKP